MEHLIDKKGIETLIHEFVIASAHGRLGSKSLKCKISLIDSSLSYEVLNKKESVYIGNDINCAIEKYNEYLV